MSITFQLTVSFRLDDYRATKEASPMRKALLLRASKAMSSRPHDAVADDSGQAFLDYALIAGCVAAVAATVMTLITHGTLRAMLDRITGSLSG
jgi:hypothetical protein